MDVSIIDTNRFPAYYYCNFYTTDYAPITGIVQRGDDQLAIGPPQSVLMVWCANWPGGSNTCLPEYGEAPRSPGLFSLAETKRKGSCEWDSNQSGELILPCCGFCMATKCRSLTSPP